MRTFRDPIFAMATAGLLGCGGAPEAAPEIAAGDHEIINGTAVADIEATGVVSLLAGGFCSGALLTNEWVLTAKHCALDTAHPGNIYVGMNSQNTVGAFAVNHPGLDYALIKLAAPFRMNGSTTGYRQGFYTGSTNDLADRTLHAMGYGCNVYTSTDPNNFSCTGEGPYSLREAWLRAVSPTSSADYGFVVNRNALGQLVGPGDSGSSIFLDTLAGRAIAGTLQSGGRTQAHYYLAENVRDWALSYVYNLPVPLPQKWYTPGTSYDQFWDVPLRNNFTNSYSWDPCPGRAYSFNASFDLESGYDFIYLTSAGRTYPMTGVGTASGTGSGPLTLRVATDGSVQSRGMIAMPISCAAGSSPPAGEMAVQCHGARCFTSPALLPNSRTATALWSPCNGRGFRFSGSYDFQPGDFARITGGAYGASLTLAGRSSFANVPAAGTLAVTVSTDGAGQSAGLSSLTAICNDWPTTTHPDGGTQCNGMHCCPPGEAMVGANIGSNVFLCRPVSSPTTEACAIDYGTQRSGMHACPLGQYQRGLHVGNNQLTCCYDRNASGAANGEVVDTATQLLGMHACPPGRVMDGIHVGNNAFLCAAPRQ